MLGVGFGVGPVMENCELMYNLIYIKLYINYVLIIHYTKTKQHTILILNPYLHKQLARLIV